MAQQRLRAPKRRKFMLRAAVISGRAPFFGALPVFRNRLLSEPVPKNNKVPIFMIYHIINIIININRGAYGSKFGKENENGRKQAENGQDHLSLWNFHEFHGIYVEFTFSEF